MSLSVGLVGKLEVWLGLEARPVGAPEAPRWRARREFPHLLLGGVQSCSMIEQYSLLFRLRYEQNRIG